MMRQNTESIRSKEGRVSSNKMQRKYFPCRQKADQICYIKTANRTTGICSKVKVVWNEDSHLHTHHCENLKYHLLWNDTNR